MRVFYCSDKSPALFYKVSALLLKQFESRHKEFFVLENITHLTHLSHLSHQPYSPTLVIKAQKKSRRKPIALCDYYI